MKTPLLFFPLLLAIVLSGCISGSPTGDITAVNNLSNNNTISIPLGEITENAKWFEYDSSGAKVRFFAVKASDGSIKTAFDACDVCYYSKKGYSLSGEYMVCNNCGNRYPIIGLGTENRNPGGCWPSYLPNEIVGNNIIIEKADLDKGRNMFI